MVSSSSKRQAKIHLSFELFSKINVFTNDKLLMAKSSMLNFNAIAFPTACLKIPHLKLGYYLLTTAVCSKRFYLANCTHEKCASYTRWSWLKREFNWTRRTRAIATWDHSLLTVNSDVCLPTPASTQCWFYQIFIPIL